MVRFVPRRFLGGDEPSHERRQAPDTDGGFLPGRFEALDGISFRSFSWIVAAALRLVSAVQRATYRSL